MTTLKYMLNRLAARTHPCMGCVFEFCHGILIGSPSYLLLARTRVLLFQIWLWWWLEALVIKPEHHQAREEHFQGTSIIVTTDSLRQLGNALRSISFMEAFVQDKASSGFRGKQTL